MRDPMSVLMATSPRDKVLGGGGTPPGFGRWLSSVGDEAVGHAVPEERDIAERLSHPRAKT